MDRDPLFRFNKAQQDSFLPHVEKGTITLIGATTENPSFSLNTALLSRCRVVVLSKLSPESVKSILTKAAEAKNDSVSVEEEALSFLADVADGDARTALNCLQIAMDSCSKGSVTLSDIKSGLKRAHTLYDRKGDEHYHCASALQKSIRGSADNAALYWCMRMLHGGEDPTFVARRLVVTAAEDVGLADPRAMPMAVAAMQGCQLLGRPESNYLLAETAVYLARAQKSHEVTSAMWKVQAALEAGGNLPGVPIHLRNASNKFSKDLGYGQGYTNDLIATGNIDYMPEGMKDVNFFA